MLVLDVILWSHLHCTAPAYKWSTLNFSYTQLQWKIKPFICIQMMTTYLGYTTQFVVFFAQICICNLTLLLRHMVIFTKKYMFTYIQYSTCTVLSKYVVKRLTRAFSAVWAQHELLIRCLPTSTHWGVQLTDFRYFVPCKLKIFQSRQSKILPFSESYSFLSCMYTFIGYESFCVQYLFSCVTSAGEREDKTCTLYHILYALPTCL